MWQRISRRIREGKEKREEAALLKKGIEQVSGRFDAAIRSVKGYRNRLQDPVRKAWRYVEKAVDAFPPPVALDPGRWDRDPLLGSLFVDPDHLEALLRDSLALRGYLHKHPDGTAAALLTATRKERTIFCTLIEGNICSRDAPRRAVEFREHRIEMPTASETELRDALKRRLLTAVATRTRESVQDLLAWKQELVEERELLTAQLREAAIRRRAPDAESTAPPTGRIEEGHAVIEEIDRKLGEISGEIGTPELLLNRLEASLDRPENVLGFELLDMRLNWMGVMLKPDSRETGKRIVLPEITFEDGERRVAVLVGIDKG